MITILIKRTNPKTRATTRVQVTAVSIEAAVKACPGQVVFPIDAERFIAPRARRPA